MRGEYRRLMVELIAAQGPENYEKPPIHIKHSELEPTGDSPFRSKCPTCQHGVLLVSRDRRTLELVPIDMCVLCGRRFIYDDFAEMLKGKALHENS